MLTKRWPGKVKKSRRRDESDGNSYLTCRKCWVACFEWELMWCCVMWWNYSHPSVSLSLFAVWLFTWWVWVHPLPSALLLSMGWEIFCHLITLVGFVLMCLSVNFFWSQSSYVGLPLSKLKMRLSVTPSGFFPSLLCYFKGYSSSVLHVYVIIMLRILDIHRTFPL